MKSLILIIFYLFVFGIKTDIGIANKTECDKWSKSHFYDPNDRDGSLLETPQVYVKFYDFEELNVACSNNLYNISSLFLHPMSSILIDSNLDLVNFLKMFKFNNGTGPKDIWFKRIQGFNLNDGQYKKTFEYGTMSFDESYFEFYINKTLLSSKDACVRSKFKKNTNMFGSIQNVIFRRSVFYSKNICPYVFLNTRVTFISLKF
jgi:hypothetical protein